MTTRSGPNTAAIPGGEQVRGVREQVRCHAFGRECTNPCCAEVMQGGGQAWGGAVLSKSVSSGRLNVERIRLLCGLQVG
jgi:hypothetical protein